MNQISLDHRGLLFIAALVLVWWGATSLLQLFPSFVLPSPVEVYHSFLALGFPGDQDGGVLLGYRASLWGHIASSVARLWTAFAIATACAIPIGVLMATSRVIGDALDPIVQSLRPIPPIAWTPLAILWFGIGLEPILFIIFLGAFWPLLLNVVVGVREVRPILIRAGQSLGARRLQLFVRVIVPAALPYIFTGMRSGMVVGWWMIVPAEMITADTGLGFLIMRARENGHMQHVLTGVVAIALVGFCFQLVLDRLGRMRVFRAA